jgi:hypothetical protein
MARFGPPLAASTALVAVPTRGVTATEPPRTGARRKLLEMPGFPRVTAASDQMGRVRSISVADIRWPDRLALGRPIQPTAVMMNVMSAISPVRRRWPRCTLRALLAAVALVSVPLAWHAHVQRQREIVAALVKLNPGTRVVYDDERHAAGRMRSWLRGVLGRDYASQVVAAEMFYATDAELRLVARLSALQELSLQRAIDVTAAGIEALAKQDSLKKLQLADGWNLDNTAMSALARMQGLEELTLEAGPRVSASGVMKLAALSKLRRLQLSCADEGATQAIESLRRQLPGCEINAQAPLGLL